VRLTDAYAHCADRRYADGQKALFTSDPRFVVYMAGEGTDPTDDLRGRESLTPVFENLNTYEATTHFNGQEHGRAGFGTCDRRELLPGPTTSTQLTASAS
jgi:hypothetical protein